MKELSSSQKYEKNIKLLHTVPGIGLITALTLLMEMEDISSFRNTDHFAGYIGFQHDIQAARMPEFGCSFNP